MTDVKKWSKVLDAKKDFRNDEEMADVSSYKNPMCILHNGLGVTVRALSATDYEIIAHNICDAKQAWIFRGNLSYAISSPRELYQSFEEQNGLDAEFQFAEDGEGRQDRSQLRLKLTAKVSGEELVRHIVFIPMTAQDAQSAVLEYTVAKCKELRVAKSQEGIMSLLAHLGARVSSSDSSSDS